jgi:glycosyltransferase involved in cell wall biosynthesis
MISVLVLTYNNEKFIEKCLESIFRQKCPTFEYEIIVWDNNSTDKTVEVALRFLKKSGRRFQLIRECHNTYLSGSNFFLRAMKASSGDLIAVIDGDDEWIQTDKLHKQKAILDEDCDVMLCCTLTEFFNHTDYRVEYLIPNPREVGLHEGIVLARDNLIPNSSVLFRRSMLHKLPKTLDGFPIKDLPVWALGLENSYFFVSPDISTRYNTNHGNNISTSKSFLERSNQVILTYELIIANLKEVTSKETWIEGLRLYKEALAKRCFIIND